MTGLVRMVVVLGSICLVAGLALSGVYEITKEPIAYQKKLEIIRSLEAVLPGLQVDPEKAYLDLAGETGKKVRVYRFIEGEEVVGVAFQVTAPDGYSGNIEIMMGILPDGSLGGIEILGHAETPGLGALITDESFKLFFRGRSLSDTDFRVKKDGGDIDQITGATISPRAVAGAVEKGLKWFTDSRKMILSTAVSGEGA